MANLPLILSGAGPLKDSKSENCVLTLGADDGLMSSWGCDMHLMVLKVVVLLFFRNWVVVRPAEKTEVAADIVVVIRVKA
ncbi:hypothetical protein Tco_1413319 [Tanacetum coccineum]